ncbi:hypothetical protein, partial [Pelagicoccus sp. SDUM812002]|uniref:TubC N-terminal docking domain-related protein n=1 Tax=Pelagicoccus sp. SDUM812002 TaxID=3041266 RepID=UPI00281276FA
MNEIESLLDCLLAEGVRFSVENGEVSVFSSKGKFTEDQKRIILAHKQEFKPYLLREAKRKQGRIEPIVASSRYALSSAQRRLWVLSRFERGSTA